MDFITLDFETANAERDSPCEIGLTFVENSKIVETKSWLIKPASHHRFDSFNVYIHGITSAMVKNSPEFHELWKEIQPLIDNRFVFAHNASFDFSVLRKTLELYDLEYPTLTYGCTCLLARCLWLGLPSYSLDNLCRIKNIPLEHHRAAPDSKATAELALLMFGETSIWSCEGIFEQLHVYCGSMEFDSYYPCGKRLCGKRHRLVSNNADHFQTNYISRWESHEGIAIVDEHSEPNPDSIFYGKHVVFTGALRSMTRSEAQQVIVNIGGTSGESIRKDTGFLVVGQQDYRIVGDSGMSSKQRKAIDMANKGCPIEILSEEDFLKNL